MAMSAPPDIFLHRGQYNRFQHIHVQGQHDYHQGGLCQFVHSHHRFLICCRVTAGTSFGHYIAWMQHTAHDVMGSPFESDRFRQTHQAMLGGVIWRRIGTTHLSRNATHIHYAAAASLQHALKGGACAQEGAGQVYIHHFLPRFQTQFMDGPIVENAGVVIRMSTRPYLASTRQTDPEPRLRRSRL